MENMIKKWIIENCENEYQQFSENLIKTKLIYGVRIPKLRAYSKQLLRDYGLDALELLTDDSYEEIMLQGLVIGYADELIEIKEAFIYDYLLKCDNWSLVDTFCSTLKLKKDEKEIFYQILKKWRKDEHDYVVRFTLVYAMKYLDDAHIDDIIEFSKTLGDQTYQAKMANSWLLATAYIHYGDKVRDLLPILDDETYRYTKGKIRDSFRISDEEKKRFIR